MLKDSDLGPDSFAWALKNSVMFTVASAFGYERYNPSLVADFHPLTSGEIEDKVRQYEQYVAAFNRERAQQTQISCVVLMADSDVDFTNLDRWYVRDAGEMHGPFILYQVRLR